MVDLFVDYFLNNMKKLKGNFDHGPRFNVTNRKKNPKWDYFTQVSEDMIRRIIMSMRSESCDLDAILPKILTDIPDVIISAITQLINI